MTFRRSTNIYFKHTLWTRTFQSCRLVIPKYLSVFLVTGIVFVFLDDQDGSLSASLLSPGCYSARVEPCESLIPKSPWDHVVWWLSATSWIGGGLGCCGGFPGAVSIVCLQNSLCSSLISCCLETSWLRWRFRSLCSVKNFICSNINPFSPDLISRNACRCSESMSKTAWHISVFMSKMACRDCSYPFFISWMSRLRVSWLQMTVCTAHQVARWWSWASWLTCNSVCSGAVRFLRLLPHG